MNNQNEQLEHLRHSGAHLLAAAVLSIWPHAKQTIGPAIENGFYEDFDLGETKVSENDFSRIEQKMRELVKSWTGFERIEMSENQARDFYKNNQYKQELIDEIVKRGEPITLYKSGEYFDLCRGGHDTNPKEDLKHFKLMKVAGAYWRGDEHNQMLTRIYGTAFFTKEELENYLTMLEEAEKRDHKKLGKELELFFFEETSPGMPYWLPKGLIVYNQLLDFSRKVHRQFGYTEVMTPILNKKELYETSGHWQHYRGDMFISPMSYLRDDSEDVYKGTEVFGIKPMNCPNAMKIFNFKTRSYRDLPLRLAETTALHRFELSGTLNGLFRAREFHQDDSHTFLSIDQVGEEFGKLMEMISVCYNAFHLEYKLRFGTRPENFMGSKNDWDIAEQKLRDVLVKSGNDFFDAPGEGAFYGPKIDILMKDSLGREWQTGTIQLDFQQPKNFQLKFVDNEGLEKQPVAIHKAIYGSFERFLGILIEHYTGKLPTWLAPVQVALIPINESHHEYVQSLAQQLEAQNIRVVMDLGSDRFQAKIRNHTLQKVPFMGIIGDKEVSGSLLSVRSRDGKDLGQMSLQDFLGFLKEQVDKKVS